VEKVVSALRVGGVDALGYHAGMADGERTSVQERFVRGDAPVIVATNAFGMGVDKADIRFVAHFDVPRSLEAYYQEIGRAGRDGLPSYALLLFNFADVMMQRRMIEAGRPSRDLVERAWEAARGLLKGSTDELAQTCAVSASELSGALRLLESAGHLERGSAATGNSSLPLRRLPPTIWRWTSSCWSSGSHASGRCWIAWCGSRTRAAAPAEPLAVLRRRRRSAGV